MFELLKQINRRPALFECYTADALWTDEHTAGEMLKYHLNEDLAMASRTGAFIERSVTWLQSRFAIGAATRVADFGCGPGLYTARLAALGAQVTGIDFSANSLGYARQEATRRRLAVDYQQQNYLEFASDKRFDLITLIMCDFCALSPEQRRQLLGIFRAHLAEGGAVVLDVYSLASYRQRQEFAGYEHRQLNGFWAAGDYYGFLNTFKYDDEKVVLDKYTIVEATRTREVCNWLQYYSLEALTREFAESGFTIREVFADAAGAPYREDGPEFAVVAQSSG